MNKFNFAVLISFLFVSAASQATDISFLTSQTPIAKNANQEMYLFLGNDVQDARIPCWSMLQVRHERGQFELNGVMDPFYQFPSLDKRSSYSKLNYSSFEKVSDKNFHVLIGKRGFYTRDYEFGLNDSGELSTIIFRGSDTLLESFSNDATDGYALKCVNLKNVTVLSQLTNKFINVGIIRDSVSRFINKK